MALACDITAAFLSLLLCFVSYVQLLYLESLRLIRREVPALEFFRETLVGKIGLESERGALAFSLVKHVSLFMVGVFDLCAVMRPERPRWEGLPEAIGLALLTMLLSTYIVPAVLYRKTQGLWMLQVVPIVRLLAACAMPLVVLVQMFQALLELDHNGNREPEPADSVEHIEALITAGAEEGILEEEDRKLIHSVVAFGDKSVREVMTPRPDIVAISADKSLEDLRRLVIDEQYSRIPVFEESIDNIIGFVHVRDIFELTEEERHARPLRDLIRSIPLVPETKPVSDLLREMQSEGSHMVIVVDEYGNTAGLATMEDLVEEILGEIRDEHEPEQDVKQQSDNVFVAPGSLDVDRLNDLLGFRPHEDTESTTVGGLATEWLGHVPKVGEAIERDGIRIEITDANERRVDQVKISKMPAASTVGAAI